MLEDGAHRLVVPMRTGPALSLRAMLAWMLLGLVIGSFAQAVHLRSLDWEVAATLRVGVESGAKQVIVEELGPIPVTRGLGHDGQYFYLIARDPLAVNGYADLADDGGYRFRRPLYGWLAGGFGLLSPRAALVGLVVWSIIGFAGATAALADVASLLGARSWAVVGVLGNLGLWLSVQLVTADALAMALAMLAVSLALRRRTGWAVAALAAAALTKDTYLLFAFGLGGWMFFQGATSRRGGHCRRPRHSPFALDRLVVEPGGRRFLGQRQLLVAARGTGGFDLRVGEHRRPGASAGGAASLWRRLWLSWC